MSVNDLIIAVVVAAKFGLPVLYLRYPFAAGWANLLLDSVDGDILQPAGLSDPTYQTIDKAADYVAYVFMLMWGWNRPIRREVAATFALRTIGQVMFFRTRNELYFFFFPNLLEPLFLAYATLERFKGAKGAELTYRRRLVPIWILLLAYKFQDEYITHVANVDRTTLVKAWLEQLTAGGGGR